MKPGPNAWSSPCITRGTPRSFARFYSNSPIISACTTEFLELGILELTPTYMAPVLDLLSDSN
jgi:hypothetical protein